MIHEVTTTISDSGFIRFSHKQIESNELKENIYFSTESEDIYKNYFFSLVEAKFFMLNLLS